MHVLCSLFQGLTKALLDESKEMEPQTMTFSAGEAVFQSDGPSQKTSACGYLVGFFLAGFLLSRFSRLFMVSVGTAALGVTLAFVPFTSSSWSVSAVYAVIGAMLALLMAGGNAMCLDQWGRRSGPHIQALHFCLGMGLLAGPIIIEPLSHTKIPVAVQGAIHKATEAVTAAKGSVAAAAIASKPHNPTIDRQLRVKRAVDSEPKSIFSNAQKQEEHKLSPLSPSLEEIGAQLGLSPTVMHAAKKGSPPLPTERGVNEELMSALGLRGNVQQSRRKKRSILTKQSRSRMGMGIGPEFGPRNYPNPQRGGILDPPRQRSSRPSWGLDYDYDPRMSVAGRDYPDPDLIDREESIFGVDGKEAPQKGEKTLETIDSYLKGEKITEDQRTATTSTTSTTITTTPTTTSKPTTTLTTTTTTMNPKEKKSDDNSTDPNLTLEKVLHDYGVSKPNVGFILDAIYTILLSLILTMCLCYHPREPRSRQDESGSESGGEGNRIFKCTILVLMFLFTLLHWGMFVSLQRVLPKLDVLAGSAAYLKRVFMGVFCLTRFLLIFVSAPSIHSPAVTLFLGLLVTFSGSLVLVIAQEVSAAAVWTGVVTQSVGLSSLLPTSLAWGEAYVPMTPWAVAFVCSATAMADLGVPALMERLTLEAQAWAGFAALGATTLGLGVFVCVFLLAKRHGSRSSRPRASGYELASQEELNQELLDEEEEDFEMRQASEPPALKLRPIEEEDA